jgi:hypothetical protein
MSQENGAVGLLIVLIFVLTRLATVRPDCSVRPQSPVTNREVPETIFVDRTRSVTTDRTLLASSRSASAFPSPKQWHRRVRSRSKARVQSYPQISLSAALTGLCD